MLARSDATLVAAGDIARAAAVEAAGAQAVGEALGVTMEGDRVAAHAFECTRPSYAGWQWSVTLTRAPRSKSVTVNDVVLLPGPGALVAPPWVPWSERIRPGDLGPGDVLPTAADDERLVAGLTGGDDLDDLVDPLRPSGWQIGLGRVRILSALGRDQAAARWTDGDFGPATPMARQASASCATCGFLLPLGGPMGQAFGICANRMSPADGRAVSLAYGCGAHSEVEAEQPARPAAAYDATGWDPIDLGHA